MRDPATSTKEKCPHCSGPLELMGKDRQQRPIKRCVACGREPGEIVAAGTAARTYLDSPLPAVASPARSSLLAPPRPCAIAGCPGALDATGGCQCCLRRAAWELEHMPPRSCEICGGSIRGKRYVKYCKACKPIAQKVQIAKAPSVMGKGKKKGAAAT